MKKFITTSVACITVLGAVNAQTPRISVAPTTIEQGTESVLEIELTNDAMQINTLQLDLYLPEGIEFEKTDGQITATMSDRAVDHMVSCALQDNGCGRYVLLSMSHSGLKGPNGVIFTTPIIATGDPGEYQIMLNNIEIVDENDEPYRTDVDTYFPVTVIEPVVKPYGENQLYVNDISIKEGEVAMLSIGYNALSDVYEYSADITLPGGVNVSDLSFAPEVSEVSNFTNNWTFDAPVLKVTGAYGGGRRDLPAEKGDIIFATAILDTSHLPVGEYDINVEAQFLSTEDDDYNPEAFIAQLIVEPKEYSGLGNLGSEASESFIVIYNMQGLPVAHPTKGVYVVVSGGKISKVIFQ